VYGYYSAGGVIGAYSDNVGTRASLTLDGSSIAIRPAGSTVGLFSTTGLSVLGTISASGDVSITTTNNALLTIRDTTTTTGPSVFIQAAHTIGSGEGLFGTTSNHPLGFYINAVKYASLTTTGLAVTGSVSASAPSAGANTFTATSNGVTGINHPLYTFQRFGGAVAGEITYEGVGATMNLWTTTAHNLVLGYNRTAIVNIIIHNLGFYSIRHLF
jgi:hypothetical protein